MKNKIIIAFFVLGLFGLGIATNQAIRNHRMKEFATVSDLQRMESLVNEGIEISFESGVIYGWRAVRLIDRVLDARSGTTQWLWEPGIYAEMTEATRNDQETILKIAKRIRKGASHE